MPQLDIKTGWQPGLIGEIAGAHSRYYAQQWRFGVAFEAKVARECADFASRATSDDLLLSAWDGSEFAGSLIVDCHDPQAGGIAHLRWFIVPKPGLGTGRRLIKQAVGFLDSKGADCYLTTFRGLEVARRLYQDFDFALTQETEGKTWGTKVVEQRFDRRFIPG